MDTSTPQVRNASRPALVTFAVIYCLFLTLKIAYWLVSEGWGLARTGDIALIMLLPPVLTCMLLVMGSLLLWGRSAKSSWCLLGALLLGVTLIPLMLPEIFGVPASMYAQAAWYALPAILQAALLIAVWVYSLRLRRTGYLK
ncbi:hypothetical protein PUP75_11460 [Pseudomonas chlororaphis]|uniref:hypothetical protein n=1 Tax=Pseudomonas chlororaphis TaxID=587753 RepID=UPI0023684CB4|nr:hypothetical protein [Pseudomonas chlororaphis]WDH55371.1 hypothetical protein PUP75_11460 [Pseudomonas chlororaphis]